MKKAISILLSVLVICMSLFISNAFAVTNNTDNAELLYDGGFEETKLGKLFFAESYDTVTYDSAHKWYRPSSNSEVTEDGANKVLKLNTWAYQSVKISENTSYILKFKAKNASSDFAISVYLRNLKNRSDTLVTSSVSVSTGTDWKEYSLIINVGSFLEGITEYALGLNSNTGNSVIIDDISFKKVENYIVNVVAEEGGTATVSSNVANEGEKVTFTAIPDNNYKFIGWFHEGEETAVSTDEVYEVTVTSDIKLTAKFAYDGVVDPNELLFDGGFEVTKLGTIIAAESYDTVTYESAHKWYKPSHNSAVIKDGDNKVLNLNRFAYQSVKIEENTFYILKFKAKNASSDFDILVYLRNLKNRSDTLVTSSVSVSAETDWKEYSLVIRVGSFLEGVTDYVLGLDAGSGNSVLIDDISFKKVENYIVNVVAEDGGTATVSSNVANEGEKVTFTAIPDNNYKFIGWFREGASVAISTEEVYEVTVTSDIKLTAKFAYDGIVDPDELLFDGGFEITKLGTIVTAESYDTVTYDSAHKWYKPSHNSAIIEDGTNKALNLNRFAYQSVKVTKHTSYVLKFKAKNASSNLEITASLRNLKNRSDILISKLIPVKVSEEWVECSAFIDVTTLLDGVSDYALGLDAGANNSVVIDDISFKENKGDVFSVGVTTMRGGKATVSSAIVTVGGDVTFTATPDEGNEFAGWYQIGNTDAGPVSTEKVFTTTIAANTTLIAVFGGSKYPNNTYNWRNSDAELGSTDGWINLFSSDSLSVTEKDVYKGKYSFALNNAVEGKHATMITEDGILLKGGFKYTISCNLYSDMDVTVRPFLSTSAEYVEGKTDFVYVTDASVIRSEIECYHKIGAAEPEKRKFSSVAIPGYTLSYAENEDGWEKYELSFEMPKEYDGTIVYFGYQCRSGLGIAMLDNLIVTEEPLDYSTKRSDALYCAWMYNNFENGSFENSIETSEFSDMPNNFTVSDSGSYDGNKHLNVKVNAGVYVKELNLNKNEWYHLSYYIKTNNNGTSYIGVTTTKPNLNADFSNPEKLDIAAFYPNANSKWNRDGFRFFTMSSSVVYIVVYGGTNSIQIDDLNLYKDVHSYETNPNNPKLLPEYDYDGDGVLYDEYDAAFYAMHKNNVEDYGDNDDFSPATGDKSYSLFIIILAVMILSTVTVFATKNKRRV